MIRLRIRSLQILLDNPRNLIVGHSTCELDKQLIVLLARIVCVNIFEFAFLQVTIPALNVIDDLGLRCTKFANTIEISR